MTDAPTTLCAVHTTQQAFATCARCGNYACSYCLGDRDVCAACVEREEGDVVPWERKDLALPVRFWRTTRDVLSQPARFFGELQSTSTSAAFAYAALVPLSVSLLCAVPVGFLGLAALLLAPGGGASAGPGRLGALVVGIFVLPVALPATVLFGVVFRAAVFHVAAKAVGGQAGFDVSLRACCYMAAFFFVLIAGNLFGFVPICGALLSLAVLLVDLVWSGVVLGIVARERHGLAGGRAAFAGWLPSALFALLLVAIFVVSFAAGLASHAPDAYN